ncbi:MAG: hypothetical protein LBS53_05520, partial [Synergistaceae bacterium]|nr:hypothetical protein [Synergistaceae bacterium]
MYIPLMLRDKADETEQRGVEKGKIDGKLELVHNSLANGVSPDVIAKSAELTVEKIRALMDLNPVAPLRSRPNTPRSAPVRGVWISYSAFFWISAASSRAAENHFSSLAISATLKFSSPYWRTP